MAYKRTLPAKGLCHDSSRFARLFDASQRVVVYWNTDPDTVEVVGYYNSVSAANTAATANINAQGAKPRVMINWWHSTISKRTVGAIAHPKAEEDLPSWIDEVPAS